MAERLLRDVQCRAAKPRERAYRLSDGGGLALLVRPTGHKYWQFRYSKPDGREGLIQIGPYPRVTLEVARSARNAHREVVWRGDDPAIVRKQEKAERKAKVVSALTFKQCALAYIKARGAEWQSERYRKHWVRSLATYAYPVIGALRPADVTTDLVMRVLEPVWLTKNETASRVRARIETILDWAKVRGLRSGENPARWTGHLEQLLASPRKVKQVKHFAALPYVDIGAFMVELRAVSGTAARLLEFTILTAVRSNESTGAPFSEVDQQGAVWEIPPERMKAKRSHRVPLSSSALALLNGLFQADAGPIFEGSKAGRPLAHSAMRKLLKAMGRADLTVHGFRSTFRDWAAECTPFANEVVEMALAHAIRDKTEAAYRRGDLFEKRLALMQAWADYIEQEVKASMTKAAA
ncbi:MULTISPECIES: tyrosine-type recombinase/integrase [Burkholderia]|uniref:tyrosine-type recombinase/integrase n=1 Tax=Burkholderia TaxID=32008 RepID=UPI00075EAD2D|nr:MULTISPECIES: integrase arm-type DNA-binding domain-containing protein [Burkholderia]AOJ70303.1 integrase [Burkholderia savannae]KVG38770.1 integrase [Burkholderia sp. MSMB0265]KVG82089.1 integrase [Burkholderia sp. MSMB2040]KVG91382.1 integrase [Burkholderia sp. MSMB2041]KVG98253.1 integrase [Burkholderia sp. MSMB2042]